MNELLSVAQQAARDAAAVQRAHFGRVAAADWSQKGVADFVTHVDRAAEAAIVERIRAHFPHHRLLAEEAETARFADAAPAGVAETGAARIRERVSASDAAAERRAGSGTANAQRQAGSGIANAERETTSGVTNGDAEEWTWIIDPLDGTTNYLHGYPAYAVSIGVARGAELQAAVVLNGSTGEEWSAVRGGGAFRDGSRIAVSEIEDMPRTLIGTGFPFKALHLLPVYTRQLEAALRATSGVRRAGSAALDLCHVATGWFDGFWELDLAPWDVAAGALIVREAGGIVTRLDGSSDVIGHGSLLAGNPAVHAALGDLMRSAAAAVDPVAV